MAHTRPYSPDEIHFGAVQGSIAPTYSANMQDHEGNTIDLTGALSVVLRLRHGSTDEIVDFTLTVDTPSQGLVSRTWLTNDLAIRTGIWWGQWRVTMNSGVQIWPEPGHDDPIDPVSRYGLRVVIWPANPAP